MDEQIDSIGVSGIGHPLLNTAIVDVESLIDSLSDPGTRSWHWYGRREFASPALVAG